MAKKQSGGGMKWLVIFLVVAAIVAAGIWHIEHKRDTGPTYETTPVIRGDLTNVVTATGTLNPVVNVTVGSQVSGRIDRLYVDYNSVVKSNEVIAEIDPATYQAQVNQATANLANARANLELQQVQAKRSAELFTNNLISRSDYDTAIATRDEAGATVEIQEASLTNAEANLSYCKILSPVDGVVISRSVDVGQTVASSFNTPTLFQIANDLTKMQIDTSVAEADVGGVVEGQPVNFQVDAYPYRTFRGSVIQVRNAPTTVNNVVTYDCVIGVTNSDYKLKPGMTATVSIIVARRKNVLEIPNGALRFHPPETDMLFTNAAAEMNYASGNGNHSHKSGGHGGAIPAGPPIFRTVYVLTDNGADNVPTLKPVQIKTGITDGLSTEIVSGLKEGQEVVTSMTSAESSSRTSNPFGGRFHH